MLNIRAECKLYVVGLQQMKPRAQDLSPAMAGPVDQAVTAWTARQFDTEGAHGGSRWAPLAPTTLEARKRPGHGKGGIGRDTNRMWASLAKSPSTEGVVEATAATYRRWTTVTEKGTPYPIIFEKGISGKQPARPIYPTPLPPALVQQVQDILTTYIAYGKLNMGAKGSKLTQVTVRQV